MPDLRGPSPEVREPYPAAVQSLPVLPEVHEDLPVPGVQAAPARTPWQIAWTRFKRHKFAMASAIVLLIIIAMTALAPVIAPGDYKTPRLERALLSPRASHPFGTNNIGQDMFKRVIYGGRISLLVGISVAFFSSVIGTLIGALAGYYGRWLDQ